MRVYRPDQMVPAQNAFRADSVLIIAYAERA
jgi:hypothetical protein